MIRPKIIGLAIACELLFVSAPGGGRLGAAVLHVDAGAAPGGDGTTWANAYNHLQTAIDAATADADELWVKAGTYTPGTVNSDTFTLKPGVPVYGGFTGAETNLLQRNWRVTHTILSGDLNGDDTPDRGNRFDNAECVLTVSGNAVLDGFVIRGGYAPAAFGAAMRISDGAPTIRNCVFTDHAAHSGGALFIFGGATPLFTDCIFADNAALTEYAGVAYGNQAAHPVFRRCLFAGNRTPEHGGVFYTGGLSGWSLNAFNCLFAGNFAGWDGGVAYFRHSGANPQIGNCTAAGNTRAFCVNGDLGGCNVKVFNGIFWSNIGYEYNIYAGRWNTTYTTMDQAVNYNSGQTIRSHPLWWGAVTSGVWSADGVYDPRRGITALTDVAADWTPNAFMGRTVRPDMAHPEALQFPVVSNGTHTLYVWGDASAVNGRAAADDAYQIMDYRLQPESPCVETGMVPWWPDGETDLDGAPRPWEAAYDMGAYEAGAPLPPPLPDPIPLTVPAPEGLILRIR